MDIIRKTKVNINKEKFLARNRFDGAPKKQDNVKTFADKKKTDKNDENYRCQIYRFGQLFDIDDGNFLVEERHYADGRKDEIKEKKNFSLPKPNPNAVKILKEPVKKKLPKIKTGFNKKKLIWIVASFFVLGSAVFGSWYVKKGLDAKKKVLGVSREAYDNVNAAIDEIKQQNFLASADKFQAAFEDFSGMSESLAGLGKGVIGISQYIPGASKLSSGYNLTEAGKELALAGEKISAAAGTIEKLKEKAQSGDNEENISVLDIFLSMEETLKGVEENLSTAQENLNKVKIEDIPEENQDAIISLKTKLPVIVETVKEFSENSHIGADFLGANGQRKYLFLFQNNQEMRATGGFIGSYGVLDIDGKGHIRNFFIDGIFNPDGQLIDKIVPPKPIQKISVAWSLHDSNWFADFPTSAKKAMLFYEKTGGPTVDGVITLTPTVMQKMLGITGPIEMPDYGVTLTQENFIQNIQYEVEVDYDKEENRPKKILSDLAPMLLEKLSQSQNAETVLKIMDVVSEALNEKHILLYFSNTELQEIISDLGWSGEILTARDDYLSVVNTNVNGFKTDGVVEERIKQDIVIDENGEIIDEVTINRKHNGGDTQYEWWNKVNSDYMRVYVPEGSQLLSVDGQTREINEDVVDYDVLGFERDEDVKNEEDQMKIDDETGVRIYTQNDKTVFAAWAYVSPQEEVTVKYKYKLPFKFSGDIKSYSLLAQKQSGSIGSGYEISISYPKKWNLEWRNDEFENCNSDNDNMNKICFSGNLASDKFLGSVFAED